jgi:hypothetical protein
MAAALGGAVVVVPDFETDVRPIEAAGHYQRVAQAQMVDDLLSDHRGTRWPSTPLRVDGSAVAGRRPA